MEILLIPVKQFKWPFPVAVLKIMFPFLTIEKDFNISIGINFALIFGGKGLTWSQTSIRLPNTIKYPMIPKITLKMTFLNFTKVFFRKLWNYIIALAKVSNSSLLFSSVSTFEMMLVIGPAPSSIMLALVVMSAGVQASGTHWAHPNSAVRNEAWTMNWYNVLAWNHGHFKMGFFR